jgi:hypothetical protein
MNRILALAVVLTTFTIPDSLPAQPPADKVPLVDVHKPTIIAFYVPMSQSDTENADDVESLSDFKFYAEQVRKPLRDEGIDFHEVYAHSFRIHIGTKTTIFRPIKADVGYYIIAPGREPYIEYGVITNEDLLGVARRYFGSSKRSP